MVAALGVAASIILLVTVFKVRSRGLKVMLALMAVLTLAPLGLVVLTLYPEWLDARIRSYKAFYNDIQLGMTREEVLAVQAGVYPDSSPRMKPRVIVDEADHLTFFMHPETAAEPDCEAIILAFKEGKVTSKTYSPD